MGQLDRDCVRDSVRDKDLDRDSVRDRGSVRDRCRGSIRDRDLDRDRGSVRHRGRDRDRAVSGTGAGAVSGTGAGGTSTAVKSALGSGLRTSVQRTFILTFIKHPESELDRLKNNNVK